jgi:hypothetical protein
MHSDLDCSQGARSASRLSSARNASKLKNALICNVHHAQGQEVGTSLGLLKLEEIGSYNFRYTGNIGV